MAALDDDGEVFAGPHPGGPGTARPVAPTRDDAFNTLREGLVPMACFRLKEALFEFDSSFVLPAVAWDLPALQRLVDARPDAPLAVFGHADPVGDDAYNKQLSGRRARAVYALLVRDADAWEELHSSPMPGDDWGLRGIERALATVPSTASGAPCFAGPLTGHWSPAFAAATKQFQAENGLVADGVAGPKTRKQLFLAYMNSVCLSPNDPFVLPKEAFLDRGKAAKGRLAYQGCGEHNPVLVFSRSDEKRHAASADKAERNARNRSNRRVLVYQFPPGTEVSEGDWPCPAWDEGPAGCKARFWPDGDVRRSAAEEERRHRTDGRTMACRFYDRLAHRSPCEGVVRPLVVSVDVGRGDRTPDGALAVRAADGTAWLRVAMKDAARVGTLCVFELDPARLPDPAMGAWERGDHEEPVFELCSLASLRDEIRANELRPASQRAYGKAEGT